MMSLQSKGLLDQGEYFVVGVDIEQYERQDPTRYLKGLLQDDIKEDAAKVFQFYLGVVATPQYGTEDFETKVNEYMQLPPFNFPNPISNLGGIKKVSAEGAYLYDAVNLYARALNDCLRFGGDPYNGRLLMSYITETTYMSAMGYMVYMDENNDAEGNYTLIARKMVPGSLGKYGLYPVAIFQIPENKTSPQELKFISDVEWILGVPPLDEPVCGFHGKECVMWKLAIFAIGTLASTFLLIFLISYNRWAYEQELDSLLWKIDFKDIEINEYTPTTNASKFQKTAHPFLRTSQISLSSNVEGDYRYTSIFTKVGVYKGRLLAVKILHKKNTIITREMKKELKSMRDLRHDNLNPFIGACIDPAKICIITEYCSRGSLKDILENEAVKLDNMFNASLIGDIIRGMTFLHDSSLRSHGRLKSSNCLVDSRWVVKITDFGLHELKAGTSLDMDVSEDFEKQYEELLWTAPELLRKPNEAIGGTQKGDVYSFGIILYETIGRRGPYGYIDVTPSEIIKRVLQADSAAVFRPNIAKLQASFDCVIECMQDCWNENPDNRPDFKAIRTKLRPMRRGMRPHIFDNMLAMMEKYADNLEALVDERTDLLIEEKKKTDALLYDMLPKYVADQLKKGKRVEAESFDCVTIFFSDIVGFTTMSAESSPLEVVDFLNDLYTCFDSIIENYDVYKVETIGDAYMVVSGLPVRNGDNHISEIASMSIHLLQEIKTFTIRHRPKDTLMLRIGIHSGAVCAGIVGQKMPRYCLFGDTVNTASRMESTGLPLRIHCSESFKTMLDKLGGYHLEERGPINIKGKGEMITYWLIGQDSFRQTNTKTYHTENKTEEPKIKPKSSLKQPRKISGVKRLSTQESPKKLRFAPENALCISNFYGQECIQNALSSSDFLKHSDGHPSTAEFKFCESRRNSCPCVFSSCDYDDAGDLNAAKACLSDKELTKVDSQKFYLNSLSCETKTKQWIISHLAEKCALQDCLINKCFAKSYSESDLILKSSIDNYEFNE